jgi:negative regulator of replication initiation
MSEGLAYVDINDGVEKIKALFHTDQYQPLSRVVNEGTF